MQQSISINVWNMHQHHIWCQMCHVFQLNASCAHNWNYIRGRPMFTKYIVVVVVLCCAYIYSTYYRDYSVAGGAMCVSVWVWERERKRGVSKAGRDCPIECQKPNGQIGHEQAQNSLAYIMLILCIQYAYMIESNWIASSASTIEWVCEWGVAAAGLIGVHFDIFLFIQYNTFSMFTISFLRVRRLRPMDFDV